jgi:glycerophosphoryl diester phosphodiesterase
MSVFRDLPDLLSIAHRGYSGKFPENTLRALMEAEAVGADMIELDVRLSKDNRAVVIHDSTVNRTSDGTGEVESLSVDDIQSFDAGSWFGASFAGEKIPTLVEVFANWRGEAALNVEIKPSSLEREKLIVDQVVEIVQRKELHHKILISSFSISVLREVVAADASIAVALLEMRDVVRLDEVADLPLASYHPEYRTLTDELVKEAHQRGSRVFPHTINDVDEMKRLLSLGVDGVITNYPNLFQKLREAKSVAPRP